EALITQYARARGEQLELVWHAESVMQEPADSLPHDDHLHLRTACTPDEAVLGCEGGGPYCTWLPALPDEPPEITDDALAIAMLRPRLVAIRERMSAAGSLVLHLDYRAAHYAKVMCDEIFGSGAFRGEIIWVPGNGARRSRGPSMTHQTLLLYTKSDDPAGGF